MKVHVQSFKINILNVLMKTEDKMRIQQKTETYFKSQVENFRTEKHNNQLENSMGEFNKITQR